MRAMIPILLLVLASLASGDSRSQTPQSQSRVQNKAPRLAVATGPTEDQTIDWLNGNLKTQKFITCIGSTKFESMDTATVFSIESGLLIISERVSFKSNLSSAQPKSPEERITRLDRGKATNVVRIRQERSSLLCDETEPNVTFGITCQSPGCFVGAQSGTELVIKTDPTSESHAESIAQALQHLLQIGGAKKPLF